MKCAVSEEVLKERLNTVMYMIRNHDVADDEETRFSEDDEYMNQLPPEIRLMCKTAVNVMGSNLLGIEIYCKYWLRQATYDQIKTAGPVFWKEWMEQNDLEEDNEWMMSEKECYESWLETALEWNYFR